MPPSNAPPFCVFAWPTLRMAPQCNPRDVRTQDPKAARAAALYEENKELRAKVARLEAHVAELERWYG